MRLSLRSINKQETHIASQPQHTHQGMLTIVPEKKVKEEHRLMSNFVYLYRVFLE